jgi:hypothetical protein
MPENPTEAYQILFPGPAGWELWFVKGGEAQLLSSGSGEEVLQFDASLRAIRVLAQPTAHQVALLFSSHAADPQTLAQSAQLYAEKQGQAIDHEGIMVEAVVGSPPKTVARIDAPLSKFNQSGITVLMPDLIVPAATMLPLTRNSIAIWIELGTLIVAFEGAGKVIYYDKLGGTGPGLADEVHRLALQLEGTRLIERPQVLSLWADLPPGFFEEKLQVKAEIAPRPSPIGWGRTRSERTRSSTGSTPSS